MIPAEIKSRIDAGTITKTDAARELGIPRTTLLSRLESMALQGPSGEPAPEGTPVREEEVRVIVRDYSDRETHRVYPLGDVHIGAPEHQADKWRSWLKFLEDDDHTSLLFTGDALNAALPTSKSDVYLELMPVGQARRQFQQDLRPLAAKGRVDLLIPGNHENRVWRATGDDPIETAAEALGVPYAPSAAVVVYIVGDVEYVFYLRHGTGGSGTSAGSVANSLRASSQVLPEADVVVAGHTHKQVIAVEDRYYLDRERLTLDERNERLAEGGVPYALARRKQYHVSSGSFVGYARYAAERGWAPTHVGAPRIYLDGRRRDVHVSV